MFTVKISLAMIVKNEEKYIERCIESVKNLVDEIVIVDTGSTDNTLNIIKQIPNIKLFCYKWSDDFSKARNYSIDKATGDYILVLDADEYVVEGSKVEFEKAIVANAIGRIQIESRFKKDNQEYFSSTYVSRFFSKEIRYIGAIHEQLESKQNRIKLNIRVKHDGYYETQKGDRNIPLLINQLKNKPNDPYYLFQLGKELRIKEKYKEAYHFLKIAYELTNKSLPYYEELVLEMINSGKEFGEIELLKIIDENESEMANISDFHFAKGMFYMNYCIQNPKSSNIFVNKIEKSLLNCLKTHEKSYEYVKGTSSYLAAFNLGVYYEVTGDIEKAKNFYKLASSDGFNLAMKRYKELTTQ